MTAATCVIASGEHQPCTAWAACSAGIAAERRSGYLAIAVSISRRRSSGTGVFAGSGIDRGSLGQVDGVVPARDARAVAEARDAPGQRSDRIAMLAVALSQLVADVRRAPMTEAHRSMPPRIGSSMASVAMRSAM